MALHLSLFNANFHRRRMRFRHQSPKQLRLQASSLCQWKALVRDYPGEPCLMDRPYMLTFVSSQVKALFRHAVVTYSPQSCAALRMEASMQNDEPDAVYVARSTQSAQCRALPRELGKSHELRQKKKVLKREKRERRARGWTSYLLR